MTKNRGCKEDDGLTGQRCPDCGGEIDLQTDAEIGELWIEADSLHRVPVERKRTANVAFCTECEFSLEVR